MNKQEKLRIETIVSVTKAQRIHLQRVKNEEITFEQYVHIHKTLNNLLELNEVEKAGVAEWIEDNRADVEAGNFHQFEESLIDIDNVIGEHLNLTDEGYKYALEIYNKLLVEGKNICFKA